jgi:hypothetical protein
MTRFFPFCLFWLLVTGATPGTQAAIQLPIGVLDGSFRCQAGETYVLIHDLLVPAGSSLILEKGTTLGFFSEARLTIQGELRSEGSQRAPYALLTLARPSFSSNDQPWPGIRIEGSQARVELSGVEIQLAKTALEVIDTRPGRILLSQLHLRFNRSAVELRGPALLIDLRLVANETGLSLYPGAAYSEWESLHFCKNEGFAVRNFTPGDIDLSGQCWCETPPFSPQLILDQQDLPSSGEVHLLPLATRCQDSRTATLGGGGVTIVIDDDVVPIEPAKSNAWTLFPQPLTSQSQFMPGTDFRRGRWLCYDARGRLLSTHEIFPGQPLSLGRHLWAPGLYFWQCYTDGRWRGSGPLLVE